MKRRERKWTKGKLLKEPEKHPILALWAKKEVKKIMKNRGESGLHFNDMRFLLCKDFKLIKKSPGEWHVFSGEELGNMREYNDYTILQKDLTKLCEIGFLRKEARGFYTQVEIPVMQYIQDINLSQRNLIGSTNECDVVATDAFELSEDVENQCGDIFLKLMAQRAKIFEPRILGFWKRWIPQSLISSRRSSLKANCTLLQGMSVLKRSLKDSALSPRRRVGNPLISRHFKKEMPRN